MKIIKCYAIKTDIGYKGKISIYCKGKRLYSTFSRIERIYRYDALEDARNLIWENEEKNNYHFVEENVYQTKY